MPTAEEVAATLTDERLREMREKALRATDTGRWGAWGLTLMTGPDMNVENAAVLATFYDVDGPARTHNLDHCVNFQPKTAVALIDELLSLRESVRSFIAEDPALDPGERPEGTIPLVGLPDEDPMIEAAAQANRTGKRVSYYDPTAGGWVIASPVARNASLLSRLRRKDR